MASRRKKWETYRDLLGPEDLLHEACLNSYSKRFPGSPIIHIPNEGKRSDFEAFKFKVLGGKEGPSDLLVPVKNEFNAGLWIELKCKSNKCSGAQLEFLINMYYQGYAAAIVYDTVENFDFVLEQYHEDPEFFRKGIIVAKKDIKAYQFEELESKFLVKKTASKERVDAQKAFEKKAKARFGTPLKSKTIRLPNTGKLFKSPKKNS